MEKISEYISKKNNSGEKVLSIFLTSGFPDKDNFAELAADVLNAGADMLEIGFPFSDPLADGPTIQYSSQQALDNGINIKSTFNYVEQIREKSDKPIILMGYANPVLSYGLENFAKDSKSIGVNGVIIPDVPINEYYNFFNGAFDGIEKILLATPTTSDERIKKIDDLSEGFVYYVSMTGTTGKQVKHSDDILNPLKKTYTLIRKNKMLIGFGISNSEDIKIFAQYCSGVIVGSAVIKSLMNENKQSTLKLISDLKEVLNHN
ncbi:MAG: tryptophan synthase subunit alpha [Ignavibacteriaceae bacterium]